MSFETRAPDDTSPDHATPGWMRITSYIFRAGRPHAHPRMFRRQKIRYIKGDTVVEFASITETMARLHISQDKVYSGKHDGGIFVRVEDEQ